MGVPYLVKILNMIFIQHIKRVSGLSGVKKGGKADCGLGGYIIDNLTVAATFERDHNKLHSIERVRFKVIRRLREPRLKGGQGLPDLEPDLKVLTCLQRPAGWEIPDPDKLRRIDWGIAHYLRVQRDFQEDCS